MINSGADPRDAAARDERTLAGYVAAVASGEPTPGGGSVVCVVAALGAALGEMVCNLTLGRPAGAAAEAELRPVVGRLNFLRDRLLAVARIDETAYRRYLDATALPKATEAERIARLVAVQQALTNATDVPLGVAESCLELATALEPVARLGNRHAVADVVVAALLAEVALRGALLNVRGNAGLLRDTLLAERYRSRADDLEAEGRAAVERVLAATRQGA